MQVQISQETFALALSELGLDPNEYSGKRLSLSSMVELYGLEEDIIIEAIDQNLVSAHYDYSKDTIWVDALEAAHFYYCLNSQVALFARDADR